VEIAAETPCVGDTAAPDPFTANRHDGPQARARKMTAGGRERQATKVARALLCGVRESDNIVFWKIDVARVSNLGVMVKRQKPPIQPRRPDQYPLSDVSIEQQQLIGLVVLNWSKLEADIDAAIWAFWGLNIDAGRIITTPLNIDLKLDLLRSLVITYLKDASLNDVLQCIEYISGYKEDRNFIVHGTWGTLMPDNVPVCGSIRPKAPPGEIISETFPKERMLNIINGILEAKNNIRTLTDLLDASRNTRPHQEQSLEK